MKQVDKQESIKYQITFIFLGISSIIGWSAVLSSFPYYASKYDYNVYVLFPAPLQFSNCFCCVIMPYLAAKFGTVSRIVVCHTITSVMLFGLALLAQYTPDETGIILSLVITFILGACQSIGQNTMIAVASQEGGKLCGLFWMAVGCSGLFMVSLCIICILIFENNEENGDLISTYLFYVCSAIICAIACILVYQYVKDEQSVQNSEQTEKLIKEEEQQENSTKQDETEDQIVAKISSEKLKNSDVIVESKEEKKLNFKQQIEVGVRHVRFIPVMVWAVYFLSFLVYPAITVSDVQFTTKFLNQKDQLWGANLLNLTFQFFDTFGRFIGKYEIFHKKGLHYTIAIVRIAIFLPTSLLVANQVDFFTNDWFPFVNLGLIAITSGFCTNGLMALAPQRGLGKLDVIETIGFLCTFGLTFGIACGTFLVLAIDPKPEIQNYYE